MRLVMMKIILLALFVLLATDSTKGRCGRDYSLHFPERGTTDYVSITDMPELEAITACAWIRSCTQLSDKELLTIFSYATRQMDNVFIVEKHETRVDLVILNKKERTPVETSANDGKWHHLCATWESSAGSWNTSMDGKRLGGGSGLMKDHKIPDGGKLVLGQEQDRFGGGFDAKQSFAGDLNGANVWNRVLSEDEISALSASCLVGKGNVFQWTDFRSHTHGNVAVKVPSDCDF